MQCSEKQEGTEGQGKRDNAQTEAKSVQSTPSPLCGHCHAGPVPEQEDRRSADQMATALLIFQCHFARGSNPCPYLDIILVSSLSQM